VKRAATRAIARLEAQTKAATKTETKTEAGAKPNTDGAKEVKKESCAKDADCKENRICNEGVCQDTRTPTTGWALEAGIIGFAGSAAVGGLTIYSALNTEKLLPAIPLAAVATLVTLIVAPSAKSGSKSVRDSCDAEGVLTLRVIGWIAFGVHIGGSLALAGVVPLHWFYKDEDGDGWTPETSWVLTNGLIGMVSLISLSIEALVARSQAKRIIEKAEQEKNNRHPKTALTLSPVLAPHTTQGKTTGALAGIAGTF